MNGELLLALNKRVMRITSTSTSVSPVSRKIQSAGGAWKTRSHPHLMPSRKSHFGYGVWKDGQLQEEASFARDIGLHKD
ncbi:hypothetical protein JTB14_015520 [Gonioctena quinquepunctata]|nr:hypothetical protein JTB14_015520 [Gonioctena quinquepunctata]